MKLQSLLLCVLCLCLCACGGQQNATLDAVPAPAETTTPQSSNAWPLGIPQDALQPWEALDAQGHARPALAHSSSSINTASQFVPGIERFSDGAGSGAATSANGEALHLDSGAANGRALAYSVYRLPLGGELGALSVDANLLPAGGGGASSYYLGLADYTSGTWRWHGPYSDNNVRLAGTLIQPGSYTSPLGNAYVAVLAYNGAQVDVVGVAVNNVLGSDQTAPPVPTGLSLSAVNGGVEAQWNDVIAGDLAGYRVYYSGTGFSLPHTPGVKTIPLVQGLSRAIVPLGAVGAWVGVTAIDTSGNESALCPLVLGSPGPAGAAPLQVSIEAPSTLRGTPLQLTASGAASYDFDLNGDGIYEVSGNTSGLGQLDTSAPGIIRANVRASSGEAVAHGGVSVIVFANTRPACSVTASPSSGAAPLSVTFTAQAEDAEDAAAALTYAWDFNGDGMYDPGNNTLTPPAHSFATPGFFNARLRVTDSDGAWSTDSVGILVTGTGPNDPPEGFMSTNVPGGAVPISVHFSTPNVSDPDGTIVQYDWDLTGDGIWDAYDSGPSLDWTYTKPGDIEITLRVTDNDGARSIISDNLNFTVAGNNPPVADLAYTTSSSDIPSQINFNASGSTAGGDTGDSITRYEWDWDNNGAYDESGEDPTVSHIFTQGGTTTVKLRVTDEAGNQATDSENLLLNIPPQPILDIEPGTVGVNEFFSMIASRSTDPDGSIGIYNWDFTGDGVLDQTTNEIDHLNGLSFSTPGYRTLSVEVVDSSGSFRRATAVVKVVGWGAPSVVDNSGIVGSHCDMAVVNGKPAIAYLDSGAGDLRFVRALDVDGHAWGTPLVVDAGGGVGEYASMQIVNNLPAIAYYDYGNADLRYVVATDSDGGAWALPVSPVPGGSEGKFASLYIANFWPAISYYDAGSNSLGYVRANDPNGFSWQGAVHPDSTPGSGQYTSLSNINGMPAISYGDFTTGDLHYIRAADANGGTWGAPQNLDTASDTGYFCNLLPVNGKPAISYYDLGAGVLRYIRSSDINGTAWGAPLTLDADVPAGKFCSMAVVNGFPMISYSHAGPAELRFMSSKNADGSLWNAPLVLDDVDLPNQFSSIAQVDGNPAIAYSLQLDSDLRYVRLEP